MIPKSKYALFFAIAVLLATTSMGLAVPSNTLYTEDLVSNLYTINASTGAATLVGPIGIAQVADIAFVGSTLYGITWSPFGDPGRFLTIDPETGMGIIRGDLGFSDMVALAVAPDGTLYSAGFYTGDFIRIDPVTGQGTEIGNLGSDITSSGDFAFASDGILYASVKRSGHTNDWLATINLTTGQATLIGDTGFIGITGISFRDGVLYGATLEGEILNINISSGGATVVGTNGIEHGGMTTSPGEGPQCPDDFDRGDVAVLFVPEITLSDDDQDGRLTVDLPKIGQQFYCSHSDVFKFLTVFSLFPQEGESIFDSSNLAINPASYIRVQNRDTGLGPIMKPNATNFDPTASDKSYCCFDDSDSFGSTKLEGIINMRSVGQWPEDPRRSRLGFGLSFTSTLDILAQEFGHRWGAYIRFSKDDQNHSTALLGRAFSHWSFYLDSDASVLEGNNWKHIQVPQGYIDFFQVTAVTQSYSPLDLYLMGLYGKEEVPDLFYIANPSDPRGAAAPPFLGANTRGTKIQISIGNIIDSVGERSPSVTDAPKTFRQAFILLVNAGGTLSDDDIEKVDRIRLAWQEWFQQKTAGQGTINTSIQ